MLQNSWGQSKIMELIFNDYVTAQNVFKNNLENKINTKDKISSLFDSQNIRQTAGNTRVIFM